MDRLGRKWIQWLGFAMIAATFGLLAVIPNVEMLVYPFLLIYGLSFFFTEFVPNATTFVYPSEIFPVKIRTTGHGISAAIVRLLGLLVTIFLLPETRGKSLEELSAQPSSPIEKAA